jgi:rhodanese-related sulfurtransferase
MTPSHGTPPRLPTLPTLTGAAVRAALRQRREIALIDVRDEHPYAQSHPLFAVQMAADRIEREAPWRLPRRDVTIAVYDDGDGLAEPAAQRLQALGYTNVHLLAGGLAGWREAGEGEGDSGGELFRDVNVPSKAFGELVEHLLGTPSLPADEVKALLDGGTDTVVLDARRFDEYQTMSIPGGISVPGAELVLRVRDLAPDPRTRVVVNCAGRTRSLIGTQSLINADIPNPVAALRNGTIGWTLAGHVLANGQQRRAAPVSGPASQAARNAARSAAQSLADRAGALRLDRAALAHWLSDPTRTLYRWDVRSPEEYAAGHLPGFGSAPGGQLVQETDVFAAVRGARIALVDGGPADDGVRAPMTAHWLAQMGWEVAWLTDATAHEFSETGAWPPAVAQQAHPQRHRYRRPYEGTDNPREAMQAYLDWEYGLVAQLARDGTHGFRVLGAPA